MTRLSSISALWAIVGSALVIGCVYGAVTVMAEFGFMASVSIAAIIGTLYGLLALTSAILTLRNQRFGPILLRAVSIVGVLYGLTFFLFGREDRGPTYLLAVGALLLLAVASLVVLRTESPRGV